jgi:uncharacterized protein (TIGR02145 family)
MKYFILFISLVITINLNAQLFGGMAIAQKGIDYVYDIDGNPYQEVVIGTQTWLKPNLKTTKYNDGTTIPNVTDGAWAGLSTGAWVYYNNDANYNADYGKLYNWYAVNTGNLCPTGYHVPTDAEWTTLIDYLGGESVAGDKLKEVGTVHWDSPNTGATDDVGFTALPGGVRSGLNATFYYIRSSGWHWSATPFNSNLIWSGALIGNSSGVSKNIYEKTYGFSVRCLKD